jgi:antitoxin ParD1/3/4
MKSTSIAFSEHWEKFTAEMVASGRYGSVSEVVRAGLRLVEERQKHYDRVNELLREGEESGFVDDFDIDAFIAEIENGGDETVERRAA